MNLKHELELYNVAEVACFLLLGWRNYCRLEAGQASQDLLWGYDNLPIHRKTQRSLPMSGEGQNLQSFLIKWKLTGRESYEILCDMYWFKRKIWFSSLPWRRHSAHMGILTISLRKGHGFPALECYCGRVLLFPFFFGASFCPVTAACLPISFLASLLILGRQ